MILIGTSHDSNGIELICSFYVHNGRYANSVIMTIVFGKRTRADDPNVTQLFKAIDDFFVNTVPGQWLVDSFPQLARLPKWMQWWRPFGEDVYTRTIEYSPRLSPGTRLIVACTANFSTNLKSRLQMAQAMNVSPRNSIQWSKSTTL